MKLPCENCPVFAICKQKEEVRCDALYTYVDKRNSFPKQFPNLIHLGRNKPFPILHPRLNKGTTRWFPDS